MAGVSVVCAVVALLVIGWLLRAAQGGWLTPGPLFALYWAVGLALPPILAPGYTQSQAAVRYIVLLVAAFGFGSLVASGTRRPTRGVSITPAPFDVRRLRWIVVAGTAAGFAATAVIQLVNGYPLSAVLSMRGLMDSASALSEDRYTGGITMPPAVPLLLAITYAGALLAPFATRGLSRLRATLLVLGPVLGSTAFAVVTTARAGMLTALFFTIAGWIGHRIYADGKTPLVRVRTAIIGVAASGGMFTTFVGVALLRAGSADPYYIRHALDALSVYAVGYMPGFSHWYDAGPATFPGEWGAASTAGVAQHLGLGEKYGDALTDWAPLGDGGRTNIYSAWRYLLEDFGWAFAPLAAAALGYLITLAWRRLIQRPGSSALIGCLAGYAYMMHSVTLPIFTFTNIVAAFALAWWALSRRASGPPATVESLHQKDARRAREAAGLIAPVRRG